MITMEECAEVTLAVTASFKDPDTVAACTAADLAIGAALGAQLVVSLATLGRLDRIIEILEHNKKAGE